MIYHDEYIVESYSATTKQSYFILLSAFQIRQAKRGLSRINNALHLYLNHGVVEMCLYNDVQWKVYLIEIHLEVP